MPDLHVDDGGPPRRKPFDPLRKRQAPSRLSPFGFVVGGPQLWTGGQGRPKLQGYGCAASSFALIFKFNRGCQ
ncbi:hypothetical protein SLA2020_067380 [Shorea laevis]